MDLTHEHGYARETPNVTTHILGIRHHGPGSARSVARELERIAPDCVLIEGPPDANDLLAFAAHEEMKPPVALLVYRPDRPQRAVYYPFAEFSPEWQAIRFGLARKVPVRFMDLPQTHRLAFDDSRPDRPEASSAVRADPIGHLAAAAGYSDGERWWEHMIEHRREGDDLFAAILEAMTALRETEASPPPEVEPAAGDAGDPDPAAPAVPSPSCANVELLREAHMRQTLRAAQKEQFGNIAVVCGAWHGPALAEMPSAKHDAALLKGLPKAKVASTWIPWTHGRLTIASGYGAGVESPGWYQHLWSLRSASTETVAVHWMARVAKLLRDEDLDASPASVIESVRLAEALAAVRQHPIPGLREFNEATQAVLCFGEALPLRLVSQKLIVGETLGQVPSSAPMVPLQLDLQQEQKRLRFPPEAAEKMADLDLRKENDLARSHLLHRLNLLGIPWGKAERAGKTKGTFHEIWRLMWQPGFEIALIEAGAWGNTVATAAAARARDAAAGAGGLSAIVDVLDSCLLADLPDAAEHLIAGLNDAAALSGDTGELMDALPRLAQISRYGNVRQTDAAMVGAILSGMAARVCIGLPVLCASLDDDAAAAAFDRIQQVNAAIKLIQQVGLTSDWRAALGRVADRQDIHGLVAGRCVRLLFDDGILPPDATATRVGLALSRAQQPAHAAAWVEGFLKDSGMVLLHDGHLWQVLDGWLGGLSGDAFTAVVPLLRRTFASFTPAERRQMGGRAASPGAGASTAAASPDDLDEARADRILPLLARLLGVEYP